MEALRLAALQTLGSNKPSANSSSTVSNIVHQPQRISVPVPGPVRGYRRGMAHTRLGRNVSVQIQRGKFFAKALSYK